MKQNVYITGALGGIGFKVVQLFHYNDLYRIIGIDRISKDELNTEDQTPFFDVYKQIDLSKSNLDDQFDELLKEYPPTFIIHVAATQVCGSITNPSPTFHEDWQNTFNVNVKSIYSLIKRCLILEPNNTHHLQTVTIVSSVHSHSSSKDISLYAISKCALTGLIRNLAIELGSLEPPIRVNGVAPGATDTPMLHEGLKRSDPENPDRAFQILESRHLGKRVLQPEEIARIIGFLATPPSSAITGQTIIADGGASLVLSTEVQP